MKIKDITSPTPYKNKSQNTEDVDRSLVFDGVVTYSAQPPYVVNVGYGYTDSQMVLFIKYSHKRP